MVAKRAKAKGWWYVSSLRKEEFGTTPEWYEDEEGKNPCNAWSREFYFEQVQFKMPMRYPTEMSGKRVGELQMEFRGEIWASNKLGNDHTSVRGHSHWRTAQHGELMSESWKILMCQKHRSPFEVALTGQKYLLITKRKKVIIQWRSPVVTTLNKFSKLTASVTGSIKITCHWIECNENTENHCEARRKILNNHYWEIPSKISILKMLDL